MIKQLLALNIMLKFLDVYLTRIALGMGGSEANPIANYLMRLIGVDWALLLLFCWVVAILGLTAKYYPKAVYALGILGVLHGAIILWNSFVIYVLLAGSFS